MCPRAALTRRAGHRQRRHPPFSGLLCLSPGPENSKATFLNTISQQSVVLSPTSSGPVHTFHLSQPHSRAPFHLSPAWAPLLSGPPRFTYSFCFQEQDAAIAGLSSPLCGVWQWEEAEAEPQEEPGPQEEPELQEAEFPFEDPAKRQVSRKRLGATGVQGPPRL